MHLPSGKRFINANSVLQTTPVTPLPPSNFPRSHSVGSLMELDYPGGRKPSPPRLPVPPPPSTAPPEEPAVAPKRKLQECPSGETGAKRKEPSAEDKPMEIDEPAKPKEKRRSIKSKTTKPEKPEEVPVEPVESTSIVDKTKVKRKKKVEGKMEPSEDAVVPTENALIPESIAAINEAITLTSESAPEPTIVPEVTPIVEPIQVEEPTPVPEPSPAKEPSPVVKESTPPVTKTETVAKTKEESPSKRKPIPLKNRTKTEEIAGVNSTPRRKSSIQEKAEKFNSMSSSNLEAKKLFIPGVKISDFKKAFEKKTPTKSASASKALDDNKTTETTKPKPKSESPKVQPKLPPSGEKLNVEKPKTPPEKTENNKTKVEQPKTPEKLKTPEVNKTPEKLKTPTESKSSTPEPKPKSPPKTPEIKPKTPVIKSIENSKSKSPEKEKPKTPPEKIVPPKSPEIKKAVSPIKPPTPVKIEPQMVVETEPIKQPPPEPKKKSATMKIILDTTPKSATLPRRTSKAEIHLNSPKLPEYRTEVEHQVGAVSPPGTVQNQRSEVAFPVAAPSLPRIPRPYKVKLLLVSINILGVFLLLLCTDGHHKHSSTA
jgi:hypothetical protein